VISRIAVIATLILTATVMFSPAALAQSSGPPSGYYHPRWQANQHLRRAACANKSVASTCKVVLQGQTYGGTCQPTASQGPLACRNLVNLQSQYGY
jgi:hypothetical protein